MADDPKVIDFTKRSLDVLVSKSLQSKRALREVPRLWGCECGSVTFILHMSGAIECGKCHRKVQQLRTINADGPPAAA